MKTIFAFFLLIITLAVNPTLSAETNNISKQDAVSIATEAHPGRVLGVKRKAQNYQVKTLSKTGKLRVINIDAATGKIKRAKKSSR